MEAKKFKYFLQPEKYAYVLEKKEECDICHKIAKCFDGSTYYGEEEYNAFCFECVSNGRLEEVNAFGVDPDARALRNQLIEKYPLLSKDEIENKLQEKTKELSFTTPKFPTWQDFFWPAHCGDYCEFIKLAGQADYNELAPNRNGKEFFKNTLYYNLQDTDIDAVWNDLKKNSVKGIVNDNDNWSPMAYIFKCLNCGEYITIWDCD